MDFGCSFASVVVSTPNTWANAWNQGGMCLRWVKNPNFSVRGKNRTRISRTLILKSLGAVPTLESLTAHDDVSRGDSTVLQGERCGPLLPSVQRHLAARDDERDHSNHAMSQVPLQLSVTDFDAYAPAKATSKAYSRPRMEVKQRVLTWARRVVARLAELGISVDVHGSDEHPTLRNKSRVDSQWVFFSRDRSAREDLDRLLDAERTISAAIDDPSPFARHAFLALKLDSFRVEVCFAVHPEAKVDVDNLRARLTANAESRDGVHELTAELTTALHALPDEFAIGVGDERVVAHVATPAAIESMLERASAGKVPLWIGWSVPREVALEHTDSIGEQLEDALIALAPIYQLVSWSQQNDRIALDRRLEGIEQQRARTHAEVEAQTEKWRAEQAAAREKSTNEARARGEIDHGRHRVSGVGRGGPRRPSLDSLFKPGSGQSGDRERREARDSEPKKTTLPQPTKSRDTTETPPHHPRSAVPIAPALDASPVRSLGQIPAEQPLLTPVHVPTPTTMEKGARVRVLRGAFADKVGVVSELDGKGGARVMLGLLSTRIDKVDLVIVPETREKPAIHSSHRKPASPKAR